jgi:ubiquinone/menaquinone biosynthesis C-methylase UbiE
MKKYFKEEELKNYSFSGNLARLKNQALNYDARKVKKWKRDQEIFIAWTKHDSTYSEKGAMAQKENFADFIRIIGEFKRNVLDIGGGWGLWREWWDRNGEEIFLIHDPGLERFLAGPPEFYKKHFQRAQSLPLFYVEGYGEKLPYQDGIFDNVLFISAIDHCLSPLDVLKEANRCLCPGGRIIIMGGFPNNHKKVNLTRKNIKNLVKYLINPGKFVNYLKFLWLYNIDHHEHHFKISDIVNLLRKAGFTDFQIIPIQNMRDVYGFSAKKI